MVPRYQATISALSTMSVMTAAGAAATWRWSIGTLLSWREKSPIVSVGVRNAV
jgi:hypothetical protein